MNEGLTFIERDIRSKLVNELDNTGILYRLFSRVKDEASIARKNIVKQYSSNNKLMQDSIGLRVTTYFIDDINIIIDLCDKLFDKLELVKDTPNSTDFAPVRRNMVCRLSAEHRDFFKNIKSNSSSLEFVDDTFEIQFRTTFSEGWHEVDHLMRYKFKDDWVGLIDEGRMLNGLYATLETSDRTLKALFEDIAYAHYKNQNWEAMIRNKFRLKFGKDKLNDELTSFFAQYADFGKEIIKMERVKAIQSYVNSNVRFPMNLSNWTYYINFASIKDAHLTAITPELLLEDFQNL